MARIREATRDEHQRAESLVGLPATLDQHIQALKNFVGFIEPWEAALQSVVADDILQQRRKSPLLMKDLKFLGTQNLDSVPRCNRLPSVHDLPTALGSMYVFEGATLGGQIISRHIEKTLALSNGQGYCFYQSYGPGVGLMWREFGTLISSHTTTSQAAAVIASAKNTFRLLCEWFESHPANRQSPMSSNSSQTGSEIS